MLKRMLFFKLFQVLDLSRRIKNVSPQSSLMWTGHRIFPVNRNIYKSVDVNIIYISGWGARAQNNLLPKNIIATGRFI